MCVCVALSPQGDQVLSSVMLLNSPEEEKEEEHVFLCPGYQHLDMSEML